MIAAGFFAAAMAGAPLPGVGNIIVTAKSKAALPASARALGPFRSPAWAAWPGDTAATATIDSGLFLAYPDEEGFLRETKGLKPAEVSAVMRKRIEEPGQYLPDMAEGLALETGRIGAWLGIPAALDVHREGYFTGRFLLGNADDFEGLLRARIRIQTLEKELLARADCPPAIAESLRKRDTAAVQAALVKAAAAWGMETAQQKRRDHSPRILYSRKIFPWLEPLVKSHDFVVDKAGKGYLIPQTPDDIAKLPPAFHPVIAFLDAAESARAKRLLTPAQLDKRIAALAAHGGITAQDYLAELVDERLRMLSIVGKILADAKAMAGSGTRTGTGTQAGSGVPSGSAAPSGSSVPSGPAGASASGRPDSAADRLPPKVRAALPEFETAYALLRDEARQAAADLLGPADPAAGNRKLQALRLRILLLGKFAAASGQTNLVAWSTFSAAALEAKP